MDEQRTRPATDEMEKKFRLPHPRKLRTRIILVLIPALLVILAIAVPLHLFNRNRELKAALTEAENQLQLQLDVAEALEAQQSGQQSIIDALQQQVEDLLNVQEAQPVITREQLSEQLGSLRELVTQEYIYTSAARSESSKTWLWGWTLPFSDSSLLVTYDGTIKAGIDLNEVQIDVDEDTRTITVTVPPSRITDNYIPQETINVLEVKDGLFNRITFDDYNKFISEEKPAMEERAIDRGLLTTADREARAAIKAFLSLIPGMDTYTLTVQ